MEANTAIKALNDLAAKFQDQEAIVAKECETTEAAAALMAKWGESRLNDAISREAKRRALAV